jgi:glutathione peroxidase
VIIITFLILLSFYCVLGFKLEHESVYDFPVKIGGREVNLEIYKESGASVLLIVNVNSKCIHANEQFQLLKRLHDKYHSDGLTVLGFPGNEFGQEEDKDAHESHYGVLPFPMFNHVTVNGADAHPLFKHLKGATGGKERTSLPPSLPPPSHPHALTKVQSLLPSRAISRPRNKVELPQVPHLCP